MQHVRRFKKRERLCGRSKSSIQHEDERGQTEEQLASALPRPGNQVERVHEDSREHARGLHQNNEMSRLQMGRHETNHNVIRRSDESDNERIHVRDRILCVLQRVAILEVVSSLKSSQSASDTHRRVC